MKRYLVLIATLFCHSCKVDVGSEPEKYVERTLALFDPSFGLIPMPNDLLVTEDGNGRHLAIPSTVTLENGKVVEIFITPGDKRFVEEYLNTLDGFPTSFPIIFGIRGEINEESLRDMPSSDDVVYTPVKKGALRLFDVTEIRDKVTKGEVIDPTQIKIEELGGLKVSKGKGKVDGMGSKYLEYSVLVSQPLKSGHTYLAILTSLVKDQKSNPVVSPMIMNFIKSKESLITEKGVAVPPISDGEAMKLEKIRKSLKPYLDYLEAAETPQEIRVRREDAILVWSWTISSASEVLFDPAIGVIPFPFDALIDQESGKVSLPINQGDPNPIKEITQMLNTLDGFSNLGSITIGFSKALDSSSLEFTQSFSDLISGDVKGITVADITNVKPDDQTTLMNLVIMNSDNLKASFKGGQLIISPQDGKPLPPQKRFIVVLLDNLKTAPEGEKSVRPPFYVSPAFWFARSQDPLVKEGKSLYPEFLSDKDANMLESLRLAYKPILDIMEQMLQIKRNRVLMIFSFTTASTTTEIENLINALPSQGYEPEGNLETPDSEDVKTIFNKDPVDNIGYVCLDCRIKITTILEPPDITDPKTPKMGHFAYDKEGKPLWKKGQKLPYILILPNSDPPFNIVIFAHGLNGNRFKVTKIANDLAKNSFGVIAFDSPMHGDHPINIDGKGSNFFNADVFSVRDNIREAVIDQTQVIRYIKSELNGFLKKALKKEQDVIDTGKIYYLGVSLGGIIGAVSGGVNKDLDKVALVVTGGHLVRIFMETPNIDFKKPLLEALSNLGIVEGSPEFARFLMIAQWALDRADPLNFAIKSIMNNKKVSERYLLIKARGDDFIPNTTTDELRIALDQIDDSEPIFKEYPTNEESLCHGFFMDGCDPAKYPNWEQSRDSARSAVIDFFKK